jgi:hypothetical protein
MSLRQSGLALLCSTLALGPSTAIAEYGDNNNFALLLHAVVGHAQPCEVGQGLACYCGDGWMAPEVVVPPNTEITVLLAAWNICDDPRLTGVQTAFEWDPSWTLLGSAWDCRENEMAEAIPHDPGGPDAGTIATKFDCATGQNVALIGRLFFITGTTGCLSQVQSSYLAGIHTLDCDEGMDQIDFSHPLDPYRLGAVCVEGRPPLGDGCYDPMPVLPTSWGRIKSAY